MRGEENRMFVLVGNPVEHSVSPDMFNRVFMHERMWNCSYFALRLEEHELRWFIKAFRKLNFVGANITIPHKVSIMRYLDYLHSSARLVGAVNVIAKKRDKLIGYNTDMTAIVKVLNDKCKERSLAVIFGCGGAARAAAIALKKLRFSKQVFVGRGEKRINEMRRFTRERGIKGEVVKIGSEKVDEYLRTCDLIINSTPVGMHPNVNKAIIDKDKIRPGIVVFDMVYNPPETKLLRQAREAGSYAVNGLEMLVKQAEEAYKIWLGKTPPVEVMYKAAEEALRKFKHTEG